ncbi:MAG: hypothetical protein AB1792_10260 [Candidatus Zixiibacteriota bacterium]
MRRLPHWLIWSAATMALWGVWAFLILGPQQRRGRQCHTELAVTEQQRRAAIAGFASTPQLVARRDSATVQLRRLADGFHRADSLGPLVDRLARLARAAGVNQIDIDPELACVMDLRSCTGSPSVTGVTLDTLRLELTATGGFGAIGTWLDRLEACPDFQQWFACEWAKGETEGAVNFSGRAAFWIIVPAESGHE